MRLVIRDGKSYYYNTDDIYMVQDTRTYEQKVEDFIAEKYTVKQEIALINNYNLDNEKYKQEYEEYQEYRRQCKERAKSIPTQESEE